MRSSMTVRLPNMLMAELNEICEEHTEATDEYLSKNSFLVQILRDWIEINRRALTGAKKVHKTLSIV